MSVITIRLHTDVKHGKKKKIDKKIDNLTDMMQGWLF